MQQSPNIFRKFFGVYANAQTYLNLVYLFLTFPLGIFYFVFLITSLALGIGLFILWIGVLILAGALLIAWGLTALERLLAIHLLKANVAPMNRPVRPDAPFLEKLKAYLANPVMWKGLAFLFIKFPSGIVIFCIAATLLGTSVGLIASVVALPLLNVHWFYWPVLSIPMGVLGTAIGVLLLTGSLHLFNLMCKLLKRLAEVMLGLNSNTFPQKPEINPKVKYV
jgi:two-component system phosphate regulon sensor histidine kinase PhoR